MASAFASKLSGRPSLGDREPTQVISESSKSSANFDDLGALHAFLKERF
jgi:hypothetical protein